MATSAPTYVRSTRKWSWRGILFTLISGMFGLLVLSGSLKDLVLPWFQETVIIDPHVAVPVMHLWHYTQRGIHAALLMAAPLLLAATRPRQRVLLMQFLLATSGLMVALIAPWRPTDALTVAVALGLLTAAYPGLRDLLKRPGGQGYSRPLLGLTLLCSPLLVWEAARLIAWQVLAVGGEHATVGHWIGAATMPLAVIAAGLLAATKQPGWRALGIIAGLTLLYQGAAAIALRQYDGSWGIGGGTAAIVAGSAYLALVYREARPAAAARRLPRRAAPAAVALIGLVGIGFYAQSMFGSPRQAEISAEAFAALPAISTPGFSFSRQEIRVKAGETVALRLENAHNAPHSFDLDELNVHVPAAPGEQSLIRFTPTTPGAYTFYCAIPGHREAGMEGTLVVER